MYVRFILLGLLAAGFWLSAGCKRSESKPALVPPATGELLARVHWLGKKRLATETNAAHFMQIWNLPESARLEAQTLDRLASAPWRVLLGNTDTNVPSALLRPLLDDLIQEECYLEMRQPTNEPAELVVAVHAGRSRATLWEKNLRAVFESLTGVKAAPKSSAGWSLTKHHSPDLIELAQAGDWTVIGLGHGRNQLMANVLGRIPNNPAPFASPTNYWLELDLNPSAAASGLSERFRISPLLVRIAFTFVGDGEKVKTRGEAIFREPLGFNSEPWRVPTNLIREPLLAFAAVKGVDGNPAFLDHWNSMHIGSPPPQIYLWAQQAAPFQMYFAAEMPDSSNRFEQIAQQLLDGGNRWLATNGMGSFQRASNHAAIDWIGIPFMTPRLRQVTSDKVEYLSGGLFPPTPTNPPPPPELLAELAIRTNLVCYDWELTGPRIGAWFDIGQLLRIALHKPQLPPNSTSALWLLAVGAKAGNCTTEVFAEPKNRLKLTRESTLGLTSLELHLLADWLESPQFPLGLHTLLAPNLPSHGRSRTNSASGPRK